MLTVNELQTPKSLGFEAPPSKAQGDLPLEPSLFKINGSIEKVTYFNSENGQFVIEVKPFLYKTHLLLSGFTSGLYPGLTVEAEVIASSAQTNQISRGELLIMDQIFQVKSIQLKTPSSARTLRKFLKSLELPGFGAHLIKLLSKAFPENFFSVVDDQPELLSTLPGIGPKRRVQIQKTWSEFRYLNAFENYLFNEGLPILWAKPLWNTYHTQCLETLKQHPYRVVREFEFDFEHFKNLNMSIYLCSLLFIYLLKE